MVMFLMSMSNAIMKPVLPILGNRHTPVNAAETLRAFSHKCGMVRGQTKAPVVEKIFRPMATGNYIMNTIRFVSTIQ
jgi:hypothetical protein